jgi:hypothetical protein
MTGKRVSIPRERELWRERGRRDRRMGKKPIDPDTLRAVGGEVALRAYVQGYEEAG